MTNSLGPVRPTREAVRFLLKAGWTAEDILRQSGCGERELASLKLRLTALQNEMKYGGKEALQTTLLLMAAVERRD